MKACAQYRSKRRIDNTRNDQPNYANAEATSAAFLPRSFFGGAGFFSFWARMRALVRARAAFKQSKKVSVTYSTSKENEKECETQRVGRARLSNGRYPIATWVVSSQDLIGPVPNHVFLHICPHPAFVLLYSGPAGSSWCVSSYCDMLHVVMFPRFCMLCKPRGDRDVRKFHNAHLAQVGAVSTLGETSYNTSSTAGS